MGVEEAIDEQVEETVEEIVEDNGGGINGDVPAVVVVNGSDDAGSISATALDVAEQVHEIAQEEAQEAAADAVTLSLAVFQEEMGRYPTRDEVAQLVAEAVAAAVVASQPTMAAAEEIVDETPAPGSNHWFYKKLGR